MKVCLQGMARRWQGIARAGKARQVERNAMHGKGQQGKARQSKAAWQIRKGKLRQGKSRQGKAIPGQHQGNTRVTRGQGQEARPGGKARNDTRGRPQKGREKIVGPRSRGYFDPPAIYRRSWSRGVFFGEIKKRVKLIGRKIVVLYTPDKLGKTIGKFLNIYFSHDI